MTRRALLERAALAPTAAGAAGLCSALGFFAARAQPAPSDYRALVCVFLRGGVDAFDILIPTEPAAYERYAAGRASLVESYRGARDRSRLLPLGATGHGFPPQLARLRELYEAGDLAVVANVGPLIGPVDRDGFESGLARLPPALFSHNDQQSAWSALAPEGAPFGWGGLFGDAVVSANTTPSFTAVSVAGNDVFLSGRTTRPFPVRRGGGALRIPELRNRGLLGAARNDAEARELIVAHLRAAGFESDNLFETDLAAASRTAVDNNAAYEAAFDAAPALDGFPSTPLGSQLRTIARTIAIRGSLGASRQVFLTSIGGFDTHSGQAAALAGLQIQIADAVNAFRASMTELGVAREVTLFTASEFGRTFTPNGDGTDHGWGGHHIVVGGSVRGGRIYGDVPPPEADHPQAVRGGRLIPTLAVEQYAATLGAWFGLDDAALAAALPNLARFIGRPDFA
ncbi:MAG: DUF1501 domain-containing protein [Parvularculaceae bacterium]